MVYKNKDSEKSLVKACVRNNRLAQEKLYRFFYPTMMRLCMRYTQDRELAKNILNDGMLKVFLNIDKYNHQGSLEGWIRKIIFHTLSDHFRKKSSNIRFLELDTKDDMLPSLVLNNLYFDDLMTLVKTLPSSSKKVFMLYAIEGYSHNEIGTKLNISPNTSKWHLANARKILKNKINNNKKLHQHV